MNPNMVNYILEHAHENEKICSICCDDENLIKRDNIFVLNCCHTFHIECGVKSLTEIGMICPLCRNVQEFTLCKSGVYFPVIEFLIDQNNYEFLENFIDYNNSGVENRNHIYKYCILTENIDMLHLFTTNQEFGIDFDVFDFILENKKYKVLEYYVPILISIHIHKIDELLWVAIEKADMFVIMYLIYKFKANIYNEVGYSMLSDAIKSDNFEIVSYLIYNLGMVVITPNHSAIKTALKEDNYNIIKLCIGSIGDPKDPDNAIIKSEIEFEVNEARAAIIEHAIKKLGAGTFSRNINTSCIHDMSTLELFEHFNGMVIEIHDFFWKNHESIEIETIDVVGNIDDDSWYDNYNL